MRRTWTILMATAALVLAGLMTTSVAASVREATTDAGVVASSSAGTDKPVRNLHDAIVKRNGKLYFKGRVDPGHGPVVVQKRECMAKRCPWRNFKQVRTQGPKEKWQVRVYAPRHGNWYWRGYVRSYGGYAKSWTHVWKTYVTSF